MCCGINILKFFIHELCFLKRCLRCLCPLCEGAYTVNLYTIVGEIRNIHMCDVYEFTMLILRSSCCCWRPHPLLLSRIAKLNATPHPAPHALRPSSRPLCFAMFLKSFLAFLLFFIILRCSAHWA